jgi:hypothetical protein
MRDLLLGQFVNSVDVLGESGFIVKIEIEIGLQSLFIDFLTDLFTAFMQKCGSNFVDDFIGYCLKCIDKILEILLEVGVLIGDVAF